MTVTASSAQKKKVEDGNEFKNTDRVSATAARRPTADALARRHAKNEHVAEAPEHGPQDEEEDGRSQRRKGRRKHVPFQYGFLVLSFLVDYSPAFCRFRLAFSTI